MKTSNIVLAVLAGAAIGGIIAIVLKAEAALTDSDEDGNHDYESSAFKKIANQFSEKISSELKTAEQKLKSAVGTNSRMLEPDEHDGVFL
jgi:hypothetical protein